MTPTAIIDVLSSAKTKELEKSKGNENEKILDRINELEKQLKNVKGTKCEIWSRVVGYFRPTSAYNPGKQEEYKERKNFII